MSAIEKAALVAARADAEHGPFASLHEAYGVLAEEVAEMFDAMRRDDHDAFALEAIDVMAVCQRIAERWGT